MTDVAVRELRNNTAAVIERARTGEEVTITVNGVPAARLLPIDPPKRLFLTTADLLALQARVRTMPRVEYWEHEFDGDTTDDLGPIQ